MTLIWGPFCATDKENCLLGKYPEKLNHGVRYENKEIKIILFTY